MNEKCETIEKVDESILQLLGDVNLINNDLIKQNENSIEELTNIYKSITKKDQSPSLKFRLEQEHSNAKRINENLTKLTKQQTQLQKQLDEVKFARKNSSLDKSKKEELKRKHDDLSTQLENANRDIKVANENRDQAINNYNNQANIIFKDSQQHQTNSLQLMKNILKNFINALRIESSFSNRTKQNIKPSKYSIQSRKKNRCYSIDSDDEI